MMSFIKPVPRAIYYLHPLTAVNSLLKLTFERFGYSNVEAFEKEFSRFVGANYSAATSHARVALYTILQSFKFNPGDEILMSAINLPDMINMARLNQLTPRIFDYKEKSFDFSLEDFRQKLSERTKVIFLTTLVGLENNINEIIAIAKEKKILLIVDQTQSMGLVCENKALASLVDFSIYSLCDLKDIHTHRGAMISFNEEKYLQPILETREKISTRPSRKYFLRFIVEDFMSSLFLRKGFFSVFIFPTLLILHKTNQAYKLEELTKGKGIQIGRINIGRGFWGGDGDLVRSSVPEEMRYRYTDMQARIGLKKIVRTKKIQERRKAHANLLNISLKPNIDLFDKNKTHLYWKYPLWVNHPQDFKRSLALRGVDIAPSNLPCLTNIKAFEQIISDQAPNAQLLLEHVLFIPAHYYLSSETVKSMALVVNAQLEKDARVTA